MNLNFEVVFSKLYNMHLTGYYTDPFICVVMLYVLRYDLRVRLIALCLMSHLMLCIAPFLALRPKKPLVRRASHIASRPVPCFFYTPCSCEVNMPRCCATACLYISFLRCVGNSVLGLAFKCRPIYYHIIFPNISLIYSNQETTN